MYLASIDYSRKYYHPNACLFPPSLSRGKSKFVRTANVSARCCIRDSSESQRQLLSTHKLSVVAFGDKRNPIFDFCFNSPRLQSKAIDFWNIYPGDSGKVHVSKNVAEESFVLSGGTTAGDIDEFFLNNAFCQSSVAFVVGAGLGSYEKSFVKFFKGVQSNGGLVVSIITKPFRFEGRKRQKEVEELIKILAKFSNFSIVVDSDVLLERETITLTEAVIATNNAVLLSIICISTIISDSYLKVLDVIPDHSKVVSTSSVMKVLQNCGKAAIGFGFGVTLKESITQATLECPFLNATMISEIRGIIICIATYQRLDKRDMQDAVKIFRQLSRATVQVLCTAVVDRSLERNVIVSTIVIAGKESHGTTPRRNYWSQISSHFSFPFASFWRSNDDRSDLLPENVCCYKDPHATPEKIPKLDGQESLFGNAFINRFILSGLKKFSDWRKNDNSQLKSNPLLDKSNVTHVSKEKTSTRLLSDCSVFSEALLNYPELASAESELTQKFHNDNICNQSMSNDSELPNLKDEHELKQKDRMTSLDNLNQSEVDLILNDSTLEESHEPSISNQLNEESNSKELKGMKPRTKRLQYQGDAENIDGLLNSLSSGDGMESDRKHGRVSARAMSMLETERGVSENWSPVLTMQYKGGTYKGRCQGGLPHGKGCLRFDDGSYYDGLWKNGKRCGTGSFYYCSGDIYQGAWRDDLMHGKGWFYFRNGDRWFANFWKGKANGEGRYYSRNGEVFFGYFQDDLRHGKGLYIDSNGSRWEELWDNGLLINHVVVE